MSLNVFVDPVPVAREEGRQMGRRSMRDEIATDFAAFAATHPNAVTADELWHFVEHIRGKQ